MPVTAKLSRKFYDTFGDELTNELVEWFNQVDATYRGELRELNELNFARFDAKLEQRTAQLDAKLDRRIGEVRSEIAELRADLRSGLAKVEGGLLARIGMAEARLARLTLVFWVTTLAVWLGPDLRRATAAARSGDAPGWAVVLLLVSLSLMSYAILEVYLLSRDDGPPSL
jgi:hypothetical protein